MSRFKVGDRVVRGPGWIVRGQDQYGRGEGVGFVSLVNPGGQFEPGVDAYVVRWVIDSTYETENELEPLPPR